jgi:predicted nucleic acid-binding protein
MRSALDTNILVALWSNEKSAKQIEAVLGDAYLNGSIVISGPVYVELHAHPQITEKFIDNFISSTGIILDLTFEIFTWKEISQAYSKYCKQRRESKGGVSKRLVADFMIGAHAKMQADRLITLDKERYTKYFSGLKLVVPGALT